MTDALRQSRDWLEDGRFYVGYTFGWTHRVTSAVSDLPQKESRSALWHGSGEG